MDDFQLMYVEAQKTRQIKQQVNRLRQEEELANNPDEIAKLTSVSHRELSEIKIFSRKENDECQRAWDCDVEVLADIGSSECFREFCEGVKSIQIIRQDIKNSKARYDVMREKKAKKLAETPLLHENSKEGRKLKRDKKSTDTIQQSMQSLKM